MNWPDQPIVIVDIDGTLADGTHREHFIRKTPKDWKNYLGGTSEDVPILHVFRWVQELSKDHTIVIATGRMEERRQPTLEWFERVWAEGAPRFPVFKYYFRPQNDYRPDYEVKPEFLKDMPTQPVLILEDRPSVIRMWRGLGLNVIPVKGECEDF